MAGHLTTSLLAQFATWTSLILLAGLILIQLCWGYRFVRMLRSRNAFQKNETLPKALVVMSLRGADPFLSRTLRALMSQSHQDFQLRLIIDSETDPAWDVVNPFLREFGNGRIETRLLTRRLPTCGLKNSALLQGTEDIPVEYDVIVQVDADAVPPRDWLKALISPFTNREVGATSGVRWYAPQDRLWASGIRYFWGCSAAVQMHEFGMVWGGSMAFRRELLDNSDLRDRWAHSLCDDLVVQHVVAENGLKSRHVPVVLINRESIEMGDCFQFIRRQTLMVRLYRSSWHLVSAFAIVAALATSLNTVGIILATAVADTQTLILAMTTCIAYTWAFSSLMNWLDNSVRNCVADQGEQLAPPLKRHPFVMPSTLVMNTACWLSAAFIRKVRWRGVTYAISPTGDISKINDAPYVAVSACFAEGSVT